MFFQKFPFPIKKGEIVCFSGLVGARRTDVALALFGIVPADQGSISINGAKVQIRNVKEAQRLGIAYVSEDRRKLGIAMEESIVSNITLPMLENYSNKDRPD